jgi:hypothetical protein
VDHPLGGLAGDFRDAVVVVVVVEDTHSMLLCGSGDEQVWELDGPVQ